MKIAGASLARKVLTSPCLLVFCTLVSGPAHAEDAVSLELWDTKGEHESIAPGSSIRASNRPGLASSMANNPALNYSAWAHAGSWWSVEITQAGDVTISVEAQDAEELSPGISVWAIGSAAPFDGGTSRWLGETSTSGQDTPNSFNAYGPLGAAGTLWMQDGQGGNVKELLGYAIQGPTVTQATGWGETITTGAHEMTLGTTYVEAVTGSTGPGSARLELENAAAGWLAIYVGGSDHAQPGGLFDLEVVAVPEPAPLLSLATGLAVIGLVRRR